MERLTDVDLQAIKERAERATAGPWKLDDGDYVGSDNTIIDSKGKAVFQPIATYDMSDAFLDARDEDIEFVINAREDVPKLLAEVERLRRENRFAFGIAKAAITHDRT